MRKYNLPPNHALFQKRTPASLVQEMLEDLFVRREEIMHELKTASGVARVNLMEALESLDQVLADPKKQVEEGPFFTGDPLTDEWERDIARGKMPDLSKDMPTATAPRRRLATLSANAMNVTANTGRHRPGP